MTFLYPTFLFAIALIAIPIIIHFFNFQRPKKVYFTNIDFLKQVKAISNSKNKLKNILVLLARCLFITALALAFAQPIIPNKNVSAAQQSNYVSIYLDNSFSMQNEQDNKKLLDLGLSYSDQLLKVFPKSAVFSLLTNSFEGDLNFFFEPSKVSDRLNKIDYSNASRDFKNIYNKQLTNLQNNTSDKNNHIFWFSDFQRSNGNLENLALDSTNNFSLIPLRPNETSNIYVDSIWLENPFIKVNENNTLYVKVNHFGTNGVTDKIVKFFIEGNQVSSSAVTIDANASQTIALNFAVTESGTKKCKITLDDYPVIFDNDYFFTLRVAPEIRIIHIAGDNTTYISNVYGNEPFFKVKQFSINAVDYSQFANANLIILQSVKDIDNALQIALRNFLAKGGTLVLFPSENPNAESYASTLSLQIRTMPPTAPSNQMLGLNSPEAQNPFFSGVFEKISPNMSTPQAIPVINWGNVGNKILSFKNDLPFLSLVNTGMENGKIYLFASPLDSKYSDFAKHSFFVPVMYKIALASRNNNDRLAYNFTESVATIALEDSVAQASNRNDIFKIVPADSVGKGGLEIITPQRIADSKLIIDIPKTNMESGNYVVIRKSDNKQIATVAFNYDKRESVFETYSAEELKRIFAGRKNIQIFETIDNEKFGNEFKEKSVAFPLWRYMLFAALFFLLVEILLIRFWKTA
jgi:hypothetical protein